MGVEEEEEEEGGVLCRGGGGGRLSAGGEGLCSTDWMRLCCACDSERGDDTGAWRVAPCCCWVFGGAEEVQVVEVEEGRLRELRPPPGAGGCGAPN